MGLIISNNNIIILLLLTNRNLNCILYLDYIRTKEHCQVERTV